MDKYIKQHWNGELSLARSYWLNSVLLSNVAIVIAAFILGLVWGMIIGALGMQYPPSKFWDLCGAFVAIPFAVWSVVGTWRSAEKYKTEKGGVMNWGGVAQVCMALGVLRFVLTFVALLVK